MKRLREGDGQGAEGASPPEGAADAVPRRQAGDGRVSEGAGRPQRAAGAVPLRLPGGDGRGRRRAAEGPARLQDHPLRPSPGNVGPTLTLNGNPPCTPPPTATRSWPDSSASAAGRRLNERSSGGGGTENSGWPRQRGGRPGLYAGRPPGPVQVLSGSHDRTIRLWDLATEREVRSFEGQVEDLKSVALSADG